MSAAKRFFAIYAMTGAMAMAQHAQPQTPASPRLGTNAGPQYSQAQDYPQVADLSHLGVYTGQAPDGTPNSAPYRMIADQSADFFAHPGSLAQALQAAQGKSDIGSQRLQHLGKAIELASHISNPVTQLIALNDYVYSSVTTDAAKEASNAKTLSFFSRNKTAAGLLHHDRWTQRSEETAASGWGVCTDKSAELIEALKLSGSQSGDLFMVTSRFYKREAGTSNWESQPAFHAQIEKTINGSTYIADPTAGVVNTPDRIFSELPLGSNHKRNFVLAPYFVQDASGKVVSEFDGYPRRNIYDDQVLNIETPVSPEDGALMRQMRQLATQSRMLPRQESAYGPQPQPVVTTPTTSPAPPSRKRTPVPKSDIF